MLQGYVGFLLDSSKFHPIPSPKERLRRWWARTGQVLEGQNATRVV